MCGIIAVLRRKARRQPPTRSLIEQPLRYALGLDVTPGAEGLQDSLAEAAQALASIEHLLLGPPGIAFLRDEENWAAEMDAELATFEGKLEDLETQLDKGTLAYGSTELEALNAAIIALYDKIWAIRRDRLPTAREVLRLAGPKAGEAAIAAFDSVQTALSALDRLEVRGRDSAGVHILVTGHGLDLESPELRDLLSGRQVDELFSNRALRVSEGALGFVYKRAAEIGDLGDNVAAIRRSISGDELLKLALQSEDAEATVLGHTRWASVGIISEANAHPLNQEESGRNDGPYAVAALNGDVDNFVKLSEEHGLEFHEEITTDAKVIPRSGLAEAGGRRGHHRRLPPGGRLLRGFGGHRHVHGHGAWQAAPRPAWQRPGFVRGPVRGQLRSRQRTLRGDRSLRSLPADGRGDSR